MAEASKQGTSQHTTPHKAQVRLVQESPTTDDKTALAEPKKIPHLPREYKMGSLGIEITLACPQHYKVGRTFSAQEQLCCPSCATSEGVGLVSSSHVSLAGLPLASLRSRTPYYFGSRIGPCPQRTRWLQQCKYNNISEPARSGFPAQLIWRLMARCLIGVECSAAEERPSLSQALEATLEMMEVSSTPGSKCVEGQLGNSLQSRAVLRVGRSSGV